MVAVPASLVVAAALFLGGVAIVVWSVETFVESVAEAAVGMGVSAFLLTVVLAGIDLENAVLGLAAVAGGLPGVAIGTVFGEALFVLGAALGLAGVLSPFETSVPRTYLLLFLGSPALFALLSADGTLSRVDGAALLLAFLPLLAVVYRRETSVETRYLSAEEVDEVFDDDDDDLFDVDLGADLLGSDETDDGGEGERGDAAVGGDRDGADSRDRREGDEGVPVADGAAAADTGQGRRNLALSVAAVVGMTVGSELAVEGARDLLAAFGVSGLAFGATVLSFVASLEELFLTVTPARQGRPHLAVGNVVGSLLFFVTANAGVIALVRPIETGGSVVAVHWPFLVAGLGLVGGILARGRVGRSEGVVLLGYYVAYWAGTYLA